MSYGLRIVNPDGTLQIDDTHQVYHVVSEGTVPIIPYTSSTIGGYYRGIALMPVSLVGKTYAVRIPAGIHETARTSSFASQGMYVYPFADPNQGNQRTERFTFTEDYIGQEVIYAELSPLYENKPSTQEWGLEIYNSGGNPVFSSRQRMFIPKSVSQIHYSAHGRHGYQVPMGGFYPSVDGTPITVDTGIPPELPLYFLVNPLRGTGYALNMSSSYPTEDWPMLNQYSIAVSDHNQLKLYNNNWVYLYNGTSPIDDPRRPNHPDHVFSIFVAGNVL